MCKYFEICNYSQEQIRRWTRGERGVNIQDSWEKSYVDKEPINLKSDHRVPIPNKIQNPMLLLSAEKQYPPNVLWSLNHSLASRWGCCRSICHWAELLSTRSAAMQRSLTGEARTRMEMGLGRRGTCTQGPDSQVICHWCCHSSSWFIGERVV